MTLDAVAIAIPVYAGMLSALVLGIIIGVKLGIDIEVIDTKEEEGERGIKTG